MKKTVNKTEALKAFQDDPRIDPSSGLSIPKWVALPDHSFVTSYSYTAPCTSVAECYLWFCTVFMRGPVSRAEKIVDPQDFDNESIQKQIGDLYLGGTFDDTVIKQKEFSADGMYNSKTSKRVL